ncbi:MAG: hypothetical protein IPG50_16035 [Myxococcales bacterium]|nr:hypothetical protein [Myxococcales bacterium]
MVRRCSVLLLGVTLPTACQAVLEFHETASVVTAQAIDDAGADAAGAADVVDGGARNGLLPNGGFEKGATLCGDSWEGFLATRSLSSEGRSGARACKVCFDGGEARGDVFASFAVPALFSRFSARVWVKSDEALSNGNGRLAAAVVISASTATARSPEHKSPVVLLSAGAWTELALVDHERWAGDMTTAEFLILLSNDSHQKGCVLIDDAEFVIE